MFSYPSFHLIIDDLHRAITSGLYTIHLRYLIFRRVLRACKVGYRMHTEILYLSVLLELFSIAYVYFRYERVHCMVSIVHKLFGRLLLRMKAHSILLS